jgi:hypothetical protein
MARQMQYTCLLKMAGVYEEVEKSDQACRENKKARIDFSIRA